MTATSTVEPIRGGHCIMAVNTVPAPLDDLFMVFLALADEEQPPHSSPWLGKGPSYLLHKLQDNDPRVALVQISFCISQRVAF